MNRLFPQLRSQRSSSDTSPHYRVQDCLLCGLGDIQVCCPPNLKPSRFSDALSEGLPLFYRALEGLPRTPKGYDMVSSHLICPLKTNLLP